MRWERGATLPLLLTQMFVLMIALPAKASAQERGAVAISARSINGEFVPLARIRAVGTTSAGAAADTTIRTNENGVGLLQLPYGAYRITVTMIGYQPTERDINVARTDLRLDINLERTAQSLASVNVTGSWIGIRGVVGDSSLSGTIPDARVHVPNGELQSKTDTAGRFAVRLDYARPAVLTVEKKGYRTRQTLVDVKSGANPDVVILLAKGKNENSTARQLFDFGQRMLQAGKRALVISRAELEKTGKTNLEEALYYSGKLETRALRIGRSICVFENGKPQYDIPIFAYKVSSIDFIEVWGIGRDPTGTLDDEWSRGVRPCTRTKLGELVGPSAVHYVGVWLRKL